MNLQKPMPQASFVVAWGDDASLAPVARRLMHGLAANRLSATWSVRTTEQAQATRALAAGERMPVTDIAAMIAADVGGGAQLQLMNALRAIGNQPAAVHIDATSAGHGAERKWNALGVRAVIVGGGAAPTIRSLPFGLWQFAPAATIPAVRGWLKWSTRPSRALLRCDRIGHQVIVIELARLVSASRRSWRQTERLLALAGQLQGDSKLVVATIAQAAARLSAGSASRPQRSILRAAA